VDDCDHSFDFYRTPPDLKLKLFIILEQHLYPFPVDFGQEPGIVDVLLQL